MFCKATSIWKANVRDFALNILLTVRTCTKYTETWQVPLKYPVPASVSKEYKTNRQIFGKLKNYDLLDFLNKSAYHKTIHLL